MLSPYFRPLPIFLRSKSLLSLLLWRATKFDDAWVEPDANYVMATLDK